MLQTLQLQNISAPHQVHVALFSNVTNATTLRDNLLAGNEAFQYAFIDASTIVSTVHVLAAIQQAVHSHLISKKIRTRNVHSEIVFDLSPTNNISESFRRFGVSPTTTSLVCVKISTEDKPFKAADVDQHLSEVVSGSPKEFSEEELGALTDWKKVAKYYKVKALVHVPSAQTAASLDCTELEIIGKLVMKVVG